MTEVRTGASTATSAPATRSGMVTFVGVLFVLVGAFNLLDGLIALVKDDHFAGDNLLFGDLEVWGVWWLLIGAAQVLAGFQILARRELGLYLGLGLAGLNMFTQLMFLGAYPAWSIAIMVLDLIILYLLCAHTMEFESTDVRR
jgi:hypothetical protein